MTEEKAYIDEIETGNDPSDQIMNEISSLREELATIRHLLERDHSVDRAIAEYRYLPSHLKNPIRWGFIGAWGRGGVQSCVHLHTTTEEDFFGDPDVRAGNVAALAAAFTNLTRLRYVSTSSAIGEIPARISKRIVA